MRPRPKTDHANAGEGPCHTKVSEGDGASSAQIKPAQNFPTPTHVGAAALQSTLAIASVAFGLAPLKDALITVIAIAFFPNYAENHIKTQRGLPQELKG